MIELKGLNDFFVMSKEGNAFPSISEHFLKLKETKM